MAIAMTNCNGQTAMRCLVYMLVFGYQDSHNVFCQAIDDYLLFARLSEHKHNSNASTTHI
jgi:hypothetical protein